MAVCREAAGPIIEQPLVPVPVLPLLLVVLDVDADPDLFTATAMSAMMPRRMARMMAKYFHIGET